MRNDETFFCTRPRLAAALTEAGFVGKSVPNVYNPAYHAWVFPRSPALVALVEQYFRENGR
jgi:hypothetical protein